MNRMNNLQMLGGVFRDALLLDETTDLSEIAYGTTPTWDSVAHMQLIAAIETEFGIMLETEEVIAMSDFKIAQDLLTTNHGIRFDA